MKANQIPGTSDLPAGLRKSRLLLATAGGTMSAATKIVEGLEDETALLHADHHRLARCGLRPALIEKLLDLRARHAHEAHEEEVLRRGGWVAVHGEESFPESLITIPAAPAALFGRGTLPDRDQPVVAIIGSRRCTPEGRRLAREMAYELARAGVAIVSGLARGIDSAALRGTLSGGAPALGVLGSGFDFIYPPENRGLFEEVAAQGALISEFTLGTAPQRGLFPRRNRLISGLALGVLVVEASDKSGTLITVDHAIAQGRVVMAVPGLVGPACFQGTNRLVRDGAQVILSVEDIVLSLGLSPARSTRADRDASAAPSRPDPSVPDTAVLAACGDEAMTPDAIAAATGLPVRQVLAILARLAMEDRIERHPGALYLGKTRK